MGNPHLIEGEKNMSRKITKEEFMLRFQKRFPKAEIEILDYHSIKKPAKIQCKKCNKIFEKARAESFLNNWCCCGKEYEDYLSRIKRLCKEDGHYQFIKKIDYQNVIIKHLDCGNEIKKTIQAASNSPCSCKYCQTGKQKLSLTKEQAQKQLDEVFLGQIELLSYDGVDSKKSQFRCKKCGLIFTQSHWVLIHGCRGCPKCDQRRSKGERAMRKWLDEHGLEYKEQIHFSELPRLSFDFGIYENDKLKCLIEIQGEQHFRPVFYYPERPNAFERQIQHDEEKRKFCKEKNIPLYEIINKSGKLINLDILSNSTTISVKESKIETNAI